MWNSTETIFSKLEYACLHAPTHAWSPPSPSPRDRSLTPFSLISHSVQIPAYTLIATQTPPPDPSSRSGAPDFTAIILTLLRLEKELTDILITVNVPHIKGEYDDEEVDLQLGKQGKLIGAAVEDAARIWETFRVNDWNLFNEI